jgi:Mrp family chromosome partitioning ATPase
LNLASQLQKLQADVGPDGTAHTSAELELAFNAAAECDKKLQADLVDVQCAMAGVPNPNDHLSTIERTPREIVADELLRCDIEAQSRAQSELASAIRSGLGESHPMVIQMKAAVDESTSKLEQQIRACEEVRSSAEAPSETLLKLRGANIHQLAKSTEQEMNQIAARRVQLLAYEQQSAKVQNDLKETDARLDALTTEASLGSRFSVISDGDVPLTPSLDNRAKAAGAGGCLGITLALGLMILKNSSRRRYQFGDEVAEDLKLRVAFVALLPEAANDKPLNAAAARGIHELRSQLIPGDQTNARIYLISSVTPGEGATSLALSLAISYAATGLRTLLIDCNLSSRQLSVGFDLGSSVGLREALAGDQPVVRDVAAGMFLIAAGLGTSRVSFELAPAEVKRVLTELRELFDVILIDGEPIVTGSTAPALVPQVDGVLLVTARGQEQSVIHGGINQIQSLGGTVAGMVFNRAPDTDFPSVMRQQETAEPLQNLPERLLRFGPLVGLVMSSLLLTHETDLDVIKQEPPEAIQRAA